ncbi:MAG: hypothetical protein LBC39_02145 [Methanobrevibacter sp.]|jgi:hypothetical protein|nr:hypothetical protein [Candidatus Methanovirga aequatorialis]
MALVAGNHFQFILEVGILIFSIVFFTLNIAPISLSMVTLLSLILSVGFASIFGIDLIILILTGGLGQNEFIHPFGSIALLAVITGFASLKVMEKSGVKVQKLRTFFIGITILITISGALMHRTFLIMWVVGLYFGFLIISKSFREKSLISIKQIVMFLGAGICGFIALEVISEILHMEIFSPLLRLSRLRENSIDSIKMVLDNTYLIGHNPESTYWKSAGLGFADGYISLPFSLILMFGLPFPLFFGVLVTKKDQIDYFLPGIMGYAYDFGYLGLVVLMAFTIVTLLVGLKLLTIYRRKREKNNKTYLGREVLLIGSLTAFIAQALIGLFVSNRSINGIALTTFIFLASMVLAHAVSLKRE